MGSLAKTFESLYGCKPQVISEAPGRVNLIGEHIDFSDGFVLPYAIADRTHAAIARRSDSLVRIASNQRKDQLFTIDIADVKPGSAGGWEKYVLGVIWSLNVKSGLDILIDGSVPVGAGLSSSAALECSVAVALNLLLELNISLEELARATQRAENEYVGMPCGIMDQSVSLMAHAGSALLLDCRTLSTQQIPFSVAEHGLELLVIDTQVHHALVDGGYAERRGSVESATQKLAVRSMRELSLEALDNARNDLTPEEYKRARHSVSEITRVHDAVEALEVSDFKKLGALISSSHDSLRDDYTVSCPELNCAVQTALNEGALGARMIGGGFGGSAIALIQARDLEKTRTAITDAFTAAGFKKPRFFTSLPSQGASAHFFA
jgi:galactokinase